MTRIQRYIKNKTKQTKTKTNKQTNTPIKKNKNKQTNKQKNSLNSRDLFLNLRRLVKMTKPLRFENKSLRLKYKCLIRI